MIMTQRAQLEKYPGAELLPGYRLIKMLGRGGFGEVWKCEAPGRLHKAIKFVPGGSDHFRKELSAFEQVRTIRHPYLLSLERVELIEGELVMVMELADGHIYDRFTECRAESLPGIPRAELLGYLGEAAEALDMMSARHGLQHLDVKPENLFLIAGHLKVGDYGLVRSRLRAAGSSDQPLGFTPRYSPPEVLAGSFDPRSDQYSLALVYAELLTGHFPYSGKTCEALMQQHANAMPDLSALPRSDRAIVAKAMSKIPVDRFPTCSRLIGELAKLPDDPGEWDTPLPASSSLGSITLQSRAEAVGGETVSNRADLPAPPAQAPAPPNDVYTPPPGGSFPQRPKLDRRARARAEEAEAAPKRPTFAPVVSLDKLNGMPDHASRRATIARADLIEVLIRAAAEKLPGVLELTNLPSGVESAWFISTIPQSLFPLKLAMVVERWGLKIDASDPSNLRLTWSGSGGTPKNPIRFGLEIAIRRPLATAADYVAVGRPTGDTVTDDVRTSLPKILDEICKALQNVAERREHPRFPADFPIRVYPQYSDGMVGVPLIGTCRDVSEAAVRFVTPEPVRTYIVFQEPAALADAAILVHLMRSTPDAGSPATVSVAKFRSDA